MEGGINAGACGWVIIVIVAESAAAIEQAEDCNAYLITKLPLLLPARSTIPVAALIDNPVVELNTPPAENVVDVTGMALTSFLHTGLL